jgi:predicted RNA methylase
MFRRSVASLAFLLFFSTQNFTLAAEQSATPPSAQRKTSEPYTGDLSIFDSPGREERLHIDRVMDILGVAPGKAVADIGAGSGWFTVRAARRVGKGSLVYAVDINPEAVRHISERAGKEKLQNVKTVLAKRTTRRCPPAQWTPFFAEDLSRGGKTRRLMQNLRGALRAGAKVGATPQRQYRGSRVGREVVIGEAKQGLQIARQYDFVKGDKMDYFLVFTATE